MEEHQIIECMDCGRRIWFPRIRCAECERRQIEEEMHEIESELEQQGLLDRKDY